MMCSPPGFKATGWPTGISRPAIGRIFMTMPAISIVWISVFFAAGEEAERSRSAVGDRIVKYAAPFSALAGVARAQALLTSGWLVCANAALAATSIAVKAISLNDIGSPHF